MQNIYSKIYPKINNNNTGEKAIDQQEKATSLRERLKGITAMTAPLVAIASVASIPSQSAQATIQTGSFNSTVPASTTVGFDLDGDGTDDFSAFQGTTSSSNLANLFLPSGGFGKGFSTFSLSILSNGYNFAPASSGAGSLITRGLLASELSSGYGAFFNTTGSVTGFVGLLIPLSSTGELHLAWVEVEVGANASSLRLGAFGYEDCPFNSAGTSIEIGATTGGVADCSDNEVPTLSEWSLINLALLLLTFGTIYLIQPNFSLRKKEVRSEG